MMKKLRFLSFFLLAAMLVSILWSPCIALEANNTTIIDSVLPDRQPRSGTTTAPDSGIPILPGQGEESNAREEKSDLQRGEYASAPSPIGERFSVGAAFFLLGLTVIAAVAAIRYVFHSRHTRHKD